MNVIPRGADRFLLLFDDITKRKQAEETLRKNEERQTFLLKLSDALRPLMDPLEIMAITSEIVGRFMQVGRCGYAEVPPPYDHLVVARDWANGVVQSLQGSWPLASFGDDFIRQYRSGETVVLEDAFADARSHGYEAGLEAVGGVRSSIAVQLMKQGQWVASFYVQNTVRRSWTQSEVELMEEIAERTWAALERARAEAALRESEHRFRQFADAASDVVWIRSADTLDMEFVSPVFENIYGISRDAVMGDVRKWAALIVPDDREQALQRLGQVRHGQPTVHEFRIRRPSDGVFRWISSADFPLSDESGRVQRIGGIGSDITDAKLAVERQAILLAELQHRVRNIMAMIRSVTARTAGSATSVPDYAGLISGRLMALARTQALLTRAVNKDVDLGTLVRTELAAQAHDEAQYSISGPELAISPKAAEVLSLAIHELATNALKYGAFVVPEGRVSVSWRVTQEKEQLLLSLLWSETRPPIPNWAPPTRGGLGTELIERRVPYELGGRGKVEITAQGAQVAIEFPLQPGASILETGAPIRSSVFGGSIDMNGEPNLAGHRILIVEDDFFLAYDAETALRGAGADVVGPFSKEVPAIKAIHQGGLTAAVIDINLGQGPSFETARALRQARVPFIFLTGYDQSAILDEFDGIPRFEKPVDTRHVVRALDRLIEESITD